MRSAEAQSVSADRTATLKQPSAGDTPTAVPLPAAMPPGPDLRGPASLPGRVPDAVPTLNREMVGYFWRFLQEDRGKLWITFLLLLIAGALPTAMGLVPALLTSNWTPNRIHLLWWGLAALLVFSVLVHLMHWAQTYLSAMVSQNFGRRVRVAIFRKLGNLPAMAMSQQSVGSLAYRSTSDVIRIQDLLMPALPLLLSNAAQLVFLTIALFVLGGSFALLGLILVPVICFVVARLNRRLRDYARSGQKQSEEIMTRFIEGVGGYRDLVAAGRFTDAVEGFDRRVNQFRQIQIRTTMLNNWASLIPLFAFTLFVFAYYFARTMNLSMIGNMEYIGKVLSFGSLVAMVEAPALGLSKFFTDASLCAPSFHAVRRLLDAPEVGDIAQGRKPVSADIELEKIRFSYRPGGAPILDDVSLKIAAGSFTAIVGQTGSGKSTLFYLLLRLLEPTAGRVLLGGIPIREMSLTDLREYVGFIPQAPFIFDATIRENLCMGVPQDQFEEERINQAIRMARLEKLVASRSQTGGVDAPVGPGGATLSGGERQRIALGRIFLRDPQIIVCDEYTANIDNATARLIHETLAKVFAGKTRVVITHQLYTVRGADEILVLDKGRIVATGTHQQLIEQGGLYREMWEVQRLE